MNETENNGPVFFIHTGELAAAYLELRDACEAAEVEGYDRTCGCWRVSSTTLNAAIKYNQGSRIF